MKIALPFGQSQLFEIKDKTEIMSVQNTYNGTHYPNYYRYFILNSEWLIVKKQLAIRY